MRDDQRRFGIRLHEAIEVVRDRRQPAAPVDQDRDAPLRCELEHRGQPLVVQEEPLGPRVQLDPARTRVEAARRLLDRLLREVEAHERNQPSTGAPRVLERAVVRRPEGRVPVRLVHAEHEAALDPVAVVDPLELVVDPVEAVDVVPEVHVGVKDLRALGHDALELLVVAGDQSPGPFEHAFHVSRY